jgi:hypothetical protein
MLNMVVNNTISPLETYLNLSAIKFEIDGQRFYVDGCGSYWAFNALDAEGQLVDVPDEYYPSACAAQQAAIDWQRNNA